MKVKIIKKTIKEGGNYCIKSLFCSVDNKEDANALAMSAISAGATREQVATLIKAGEYKGSVAYTFGLNCSGFTFDHVERFGVIDATIIFIKNDKGFIHAKIQIIDKVEQVHGYEPPESEVTGWASPAPDAKEPASPTNYNFPDSSPLPPFVAAQAGDDSANDLPF